MTDSFGNDGYRLTSLIARLYEAALDPTQYGSVLRQVVNAVGGSRGTLHFALVDTGRDRVSDSYELDPDILDLWQREFDGYDPFTERRGSVAAGEIAIGSEILSRDEFHSSRIYKPCFNALGVEDFIALSFVNDRSGMGVLSVHRSMDDGPFPSSSMRKARAIAPHLALIAKIQSRFDDFAELRDWSENAVDLLPFAVFALDERGRVLWNNTLAERLVARADAFAVRNGRLELRSPSTHAFQQALMCALPVRGGAPAVGSHVLVLRKGLVRPYQVLTAPLTTRTSALGFGFTRVRAATLVVVSDPDVPPRLSIPVLQKLFNLTPTLARLAAAIASGKTVAEYADDNLIVEDTARRHLKDLMARTGTRRQAELVRVLLSGVASLGSNGNPSK